MLCPDREAYSELVMPSRTDAATTPNIPIAASSSEPRATAPSNVAPVRCCRSALATMSCIVRASPTATQESILRTANHKCQVTQQLAERRVLAAD